MKSIRLVVVASFFILGLAGYSSAQDKAAPYYQAGNTFYTQKNYDQAIRYYQYSTQLNPQLWQAYQGMGNSYYAKGDKQKALESYQKALDINPNNPQLNPFVQALRDELNQAPPPPGASPSANTPQSNSGRNISSPSESIAGKFEMRPAIGIAVDSGGSDIGVGGGLGGFYMLDNNFGIGGVLHFYSFGISATSTGLYVTQSSTLGSDTVTTSNNLGLLEIEAALKYKFGDGSMKPYVIGGFGIDDLMLSGSTKYTYQDGLPKYGDESSTMTPYSSMYPFVDAGAGLEFSAGSFSVFVEGRINVIIANGTTGTYIPLEGGLSFDL